MRYVSEFRQQSLARQLSAAIAAEVKPQRRYNLMEFCGGHTHAIFRYGVQELMPDNVSFVHGPGCPVCVLPIGRIDSAIHLLEAQDVTLVTYGDLLRVPASGRKSLLKVKAAGADVRMVYSTRDALKIARENPQRQVVFFAIGFETTTPPTAVAIRQAQAEGLENFSVFCNHVLTPAAIQNILESPEVRELGSVSIDGFFGPSHV
ncbi:MAG: hydrogenase formation protein HypD, partial [Gammaproteobacteria bacterium]|nr:hydrogenase formation protein HypD [Gammaproteobacteria bacterium]